MLAASSGAASPGADQEIDLFHVKHLSGPDGLCAIGIRLRLLQNDSGSGRCTKAIRATRRWEMIQTSCRGAARSLVQGSISPRRALSSPRDRALGYIARNG